MTLSISKTDFDWPYGVQTLRVILSSIHSEESISNYVVPVDPAVNVSPGQDFAETNRGKLSSYTFQIELVDECWYSALSPAEFTFS